MVLTDVEMQSRRVSPAFGRVSWHSVNVSIWVLEGNTNIIPSSVSSACTDSPPPLSKGANWMRAVKYLLAMWKQSSSSFFSKWLDSSVLRIEIEVSLPRGPPMRKIDVHAIVALVYVGLVACACSV